MHVSFPLLSLPAELRLEVYTHLLVDTTSYVVPIANLAPYRSPETSLHPAILGTCKLVHREAAPVLYGQNMFLIRTFPLRNAVPELLAYVGRENAGLIRRIFTEKHKPAMIPGVIDIQHLKDRYKAMGIMWDELHFWAVRVSSGVEIDGWVNKCCEVERVDSEAVYKAGVRAHWWEHYERMKAKGFFAGFDLGKCEGWVVKKGCVGRV